MSRYDSLHKFAGEERERYLAFRHRHYRKCNNPRWYIVDLRSMGIGEGISVKCPVCGQEEDITDVYTW